MELQMTEHARVPDADGMAALGICESLLIALTDLKIIGEKDARDLLADVATTHNEAARHRKRRRSIRRWSRLCDESLRARTACGTRGRR